MVESRFSGNTFAVEQRLMTWDEVAVAYSLKTGDEITAVQARSNGARAHEKLREGLADVAADWWDEAGASIENYALDHRKGGGEE